MSKKTYYELTQENAQLQAKIYQLEAILIGGGGANKALADAYANAQETIRGLESVTDYLKDLVPEGILTPPDHVELSYVGEDEPTTTKTYNLMVAATLYLRTGIGDNDIEVIKTPMAIYQGTKQEFLAEVPNQLLMLLSRIPSPTDFYRTPPANLPMEHLGRVLHDLASARMISPVEYKRRRLEAFKAYWESVKDENGKYSMTLDDTRTAFYHFFDGTFENWEKRITRTTSAFTGMTKLVMEKRKR